MDVSALNIVSFNCNGVLGKLPAINELCLRADIVMLQETWHMPSQAVLFERINPGFAAYSVSAVDDSELLSGRPYGGLVILWRKTLGFYSKIIRFEDKSYCFENLYKLYGYNSSECLFAVL